MWRKSCPNDFMWAIAGMIADRYFTTWAGHVSNAKSGGRHHTAFAQWQERLASNADYLSLSIHIINFCHFGEL
jgi:hypothetical protein